VNAASGFLEQLRARPLYPALGVLMIVIAAAGFVPESAYLMRRHAVPNYPIVHLHAVVFGGWLLLFVTQAVLAATGHIDWHRRLGKFLLVYAALMFVVGVLVTLDRFAHEVEVGELVQARHVNLAPVVDMLLFPPFFIAAWLCRRNPEVHKRLMVVTATMLLYAAVIRIAGIRHSTLLTMLAWSLPIVVGMTHDLAVRKTLSRVYVAGLVVVIICSMRPMLEDSTPWKGATNWLAQEVLRHS
jgi:hypothetical protein